MNYGRYEIIRELGMGSMGVVYEAHDPRIERRVTLKVLRLDRLEDEAFVSRFLKEARAIGRLSHPNIVKIYDVGEDKGTIYIAMEFIEGRPLCDLIGERRFDLQEIVDFGIQICETLDYAHLNGVVHRDIKPSNTIVQPDGRIKITDFGVARIDNPLEILQTRDGEILGTPAYMSPEQVLGKQVDGRSDLFSLGVVLYELSTGLRPFGREGKSLGTIFNEIVNSHPPVPEAANPEIASWFSEIVMKAMSKAPEERFETGWTMAEALRDSWEKEGGGRSSKAAQSIAKRKAKRLAVLTALLLMAAVGMIVAAFNLDADLSPRSGAKAGEGRQYVDLFENPWEGRQADHSADRGDRQREANNKDRERTGHSTLAMKLKELRGSTWLAGTLFLIASLSGLAAGLRVLGKRRRRTPLDSGKPGGVVFKPDDALRSKSYLSRKHDLPVCHQELEGLDVAVDEVICSQKPSLKLVAAQEHTKHGAARVNKRNGGGDGFVPMPVPPAVQLSPKAEPLEEESQAPRPLMAVLSVRESCAGTVPALDPMAERVLPLPVGAEGVMPNSLHGGATGNPGEPRTCGADFPDSKAGEFVLAPIVLAGKPAPQALQALDSTALQSTGVSGSFSVGRPTGSGSLERGVRAVWGVALQILDDSGIKHALGIVLGAASGAPSLSGRIRYRFLAAKLCLKGERADLARPILEELYTLIEDFHLELWESPEWIVEVLRTLYECLLLGEPTHEDTLWAAELYGKLSLAEQTLEGKSLKS